MPGGLPAPVVTPSSEVIGPQTKIAIKCTAPHVDIYYTLTGEKPEPFGSNRRTMLYRRPFTLSVGRRVVKAVAVSKKELRAAPSSVMTKFYEVEEGAIAPDGDADMSVEEDRADKEHRSSSPLLSEFGAPVLKSTARNEAKNERERPASQTQARRPNRSSPVGHKSTLRKAPARGLPSEEAGEPHSPRSPRRSSVISPVYDAYQREAIVSSIAARSSPAALTSVVAGRPLADSHANGAATAVSTVFASFAGPASVQTSANVNCPPQLQTIPQLYPPVPSASMVAGAPAPQPYLSATMQSYPNGAAPQSYLPMPLGGVVSASAMYSPVPDARTGDLAAIDAARRAQSRLDALLQACTQPGELHAVSSTAYPPTGPFPPAPATVAPYAVPVAYPPTGMGTAPHEARMAPNAVPAVSNFSRTDASTQSAVAHVHAGFSTDRAEQHDAGTDAGAPDSPDELQAAFKALMLGSGGKAQSAQDHSSDRRRQKKMQAVMRARASQTDISGDVVKPTKETTGKNSKTVGDVSGGNGHWRRQVDHISHHLKQYLQAHPVLQEAMGRPTLADVASCRIQEDDGGVVLTIRLNNPSAAAMAALEAGKTRQTLMERVSSGKKSAGASPGRSQDNRKDQSGDVPVRSRKDAQEAARDRIVRSGRERTAHAARRAGNDSDEDEVFDTIAAHHVPGGESDDDWLGSSSKSKESTRRRDAVPAGAHLQKPVKAYQDGVTAELFEEVSADQDGDQNSVLGLLNRGADPNGLSLARTHPLYEAAKNGFLGCVKQLLKAGAEVNALNGDNKSTALHAAVMAKDNSQALVELLLEYKADTSIKAKDGRTAYGLAGRKQEAEAISKHMGKTLLADFAKSTL